MPSGITPWSGGPRTPITYNLRPGQFRSTRVNVFPSQTIINNNIGNFGTYGCYDNGCCGGGGNKMGWFGWTMLGGMGLSFLGNLFSGIFGGGKSEGAGDQPTQEKPLDLKALKNDAKAYEEQLGVKISVLSDGSLLCNGKKYDSFDDLLEDFPDKNDSTTTSEPSSNTPSDTSEPTQKAFTLEGFNFDANFKVKELQDDKTNPLRFANNATTTVNSEKGTNIDAPKTITVQSNNKEYKFELIDDVSRLVAGQPVYKCTNNGDSLTEDKIQEYILNKDGNFYQDANTIGYGTALGN